MTAKERKLKFAKECKRAQKGAKERKRALARKNCKLTGLKQPGLGTHQELLEDYSCFVSLGTGTTQTSPKIPTIIQF